jgi:hypothetical protein
VLDAPLAPKGEAKSGLPDKFEPAVGPPAGAVARRGPPNGESEGPVSENGEGAGACILWIPGAVNAKLPGGPLFVGGAAGA